MNIKKLNITEKGLAKGAVILGFCAGAYAILHATIAISGIAYDFSEALMDKLFKDSKTDDENTTMDSDPDTITGSDADADDNAEVKIPPTPSFIPFDQSTTVSDHAETDNIAVDKAVNWNAPLDKG